jgi:hypothetical protein
MIFLPPAALQVAGDCLFTGLCGIRHVHSGWASGVLFIAVGLVIVGVLGFRSARRDPS